MVETRPYGSWTSPIDAAALVAGAVSFADVTTDGDTVLWLRSLPQQGGRSAVMRCSADGSTAEISPPGFDARTQVHEYGGGALAAGGGVVLACGWDDQRVYRIDGATRTAEPVTRAPAAPRGRRWAAMAVSPDAGWFVAVRETHGADRDRPPPPATPDEAVNEIVRVDLTTGEETLLASGRDFYGDPWISPDGRQLAWLEWDHPEMPWDAAELHVGTLTDSGRSLAEIVHIAGGLTPGGSHRGIAVADAGWTEDGRLVLAHDPDGWFRLATWTREEGLRPLGPDEPGVERGLPRWQHGTSSLCALPAIGAIWTIACHTGLLRVEDAAGGRITDDAVTFVTSLTAAHDHAVAIVGGPALPPTVARLRPDGSLQALDAAAVGVDLARFGVIPQPISFATGPVGSRDDTGHALFYPPRNDRFTGVIGENPPVIVATHGGPTGAARPYVDAALLYWTSRGFAVVDVNYRGSAGFGRAYRDSLRGRWGILDVEDVVAAVDHLGAEGLVDGDRAVIRGGSAGGYTTLMALCVTDAFVAGCSLFGVGDLAALARDTHKFESRYLDGLVGTWPQAEETYRQRSPILLTETLRTPMLILQGDEDEVVPPDQAETMVAALRENGVEHAYILFEGEQHGFRKAASIVTAREAELTFYGHVLGIDTDPSIPLEVRGGR